MSARQTLLATLGFVLVVALAAVFLLTGDEDDGGPVQPVLQTEDAQAETDNLEASTTPDTNRPEPLTAVHDAGQPVPQRLAASAAWCSATGRITDRAGEGIPAATVIAFLSGPGAPFRSREDLGLMDLTDATGHFQLDGLPPGQPLGLEITAKGWAPELHEPFQGKPEELLELGSISLGRGMSLQGHVTDVVDGRFLEGATLTLTDLSTHHRRSDEERVILAEATSDATGSYRFDNLAQRQYGLDVSLEGYTRLSSVVTFMLTGGGSGARQDFQLDPASSRLGGLLTDRSGTPLAHVELRVTRLPRRTNTYLVETARTDAGGRFEFEGLPEGRLDLDVVSTEWYLNHPVGLETGRLDHIVKAQAAQVVHGTIQVTSGKTPTDFRVTVKPDGRTGAALVQSGRPRLYIEAADPPGTFTFQGLRPGTYRFEIAAPGFATTMSPTVTLVADTHDTQVLIVVRQGGVVTGSLVPPVQDVRVELRGADYDPSMVVESTFPTPPIHGLAVRTDADGRFRLTHVPPGSYVVSAWPASAPPIHKRDVIVEEGIATDAGELHSLAGGRLSGRVLGPDGQPRRGARVVASNETHHGQATTDANGLYDLPALPPGSYEVMATPGDLWEALRFEARAAILIAADQEQHLDLQLETRRRGR